MVEQIANMVALNEPHNLFGWPKDSIDKDMLVKSFLENNKSKNWVLSEIQIYSSYTK